MRIEFGLRQIGFVVVGALAVVDAGEGQHMGACAERGGPVEIVVTQTLGIEDPVGIRTRVGEHHAHVAQATAMANVAAVTPIGQPCPADHGLRLARGAQVSKIDDAVVVERAVHDLPGAA
jgi:hypothetical protein